MSDASTKKKRFGLAKNVQAEAEEQGWSLRCLCGKDLAGFRQEENQKLACPNCERLHFILPNNTYPQPKRIKKKKKKRNKGEPFQKVVLRKARAAGGKLRTGTKRLLIGTARRGKQSVVGTAAEIRSWFTPLRIAIGSLVIILIAAGALGYRQHARGQALQVLREATKQGELALKNGNWNEATEQYREAAIAVNQLGRTDHFAWQVLQKDRELQAIDGLCSVSLAEMIESISAKGKTTLDWETEFRSLIANRWLVMESWIDLESGEDSSEAILFNTINIGKEKVSIIWSSDLFLPLKQTSPVHAVLAGQIEKLERADDPRFDWVITIRAETAFLWGFEQTTVPLGFELDSPWLPEESIRKVLAKQREPFKELKEKRFIN